LCERLLISDSFLHSCSKQEVNMSYDR
jgi:hypothetical protein